MRFVSIALALAVVLSLPAPSEAAPITTVIDFNSAPTGAYTSLVVGDFTFTWVGFGDTQQVGTIGASNNALIDSPANNGFGAEVIMSLTSGGPFTVTQFDIINLTDPAGGGNAGDFVNYGVRFGGVPYDFPATQTAVRNDLVNVTALLINIVSGGHSYAVDNIHVTHDAPTAMPEPATLSLIGVGALGLAYRLRRRTREVSGE